MGALEKKRLGLMLHLGCIQWRMTEMSSSILSSSLRKFREANSEKLSDSLIVSERSTALAQLKPFCQYATHIFKAVFAFGSPPSVFNLCNPTAENERKHGDKL